MSAGLRRYVEEPGGIYSFRGEHHWLSNFTLVWIEYEHIWFPSTEHAYQAAKSLDPDVRARIAAARTPGQAKRMGGPGIVQLRPDWEDVCTQVMMDVNWFKFTRYPVLGDKLRATTGPLVEGNTWGDQRWGAIWHPATASWVGENRLGRVLMTIRAHLGGVACP